MGLLMRIGVVWILAGVIMTMTGCFKVCVSTENIDSSEAIQHMTTNPLSNGVNSLFTRRENDKAK
jgi:hypothetical protein